MMLPLSLVALYRYGFETCDAKGPRHVQKHKPCETKAALLHVGSQESVLKVPKRGQFPENAKGGGKKATGGGGAKPHEENPHGKQFPTPLTSVRLHFPQVTSEIIFGGSPKMVSKGPSSRGFAFRYVLPPPRLAVP